jgi:RNA polymerase sigma-70 factor (ECF subfamily)
VRNIVADSGPKNLERLLERIAANKDHDAFAELYSATKKRLFSRVRLIVRRQDLAEEIIQDVYLRIWSYAGSYRSSLGSPITWMMSIARNIAIDHLRKTGRETSDDDSMLLTLPSEWPTAIEHIEAWEEDQNAAQQQLRVFAALQALNPVRRDLVLRAYLHGESREQLSKTTGVPVNTVKTWIRRALLEVETILRNTETDNDHTTSARSIADVHLNASREANLVGSKSAASIRRRQGHHEVMPQCMPENRYVRVGVDHP